MNVHIVMDYHELGSLDQYLGLTKPLLESEVKIITEQVLRALEYMHGLKDKIMHRDLKPAVCSLPLSVKICIT